MTVEQMTRMIGCEYEMCRTVCDLKALANEIGASGVEGAFVASRDLHLARRLVRRALKRLDGPLTEAARLAEAQSTPDF